MLDDVKDDHDAAAADIQVDICDDVIPDSDYIADAGADANVDDDAGCAEDVRMVLALLWCLNYRCVPSAAIC